MVTSCPSNLPACSIVMVVIARYLVEFSKKQFSREPPGGRYSASWKRISMARTFEGG
jgi:hypothetical protein